MFLIKITGNWYRCPGYLIEENCVESEVVYTRAQAEQYCYNLRFARDHRKAFRGCDDDEYFIVKSFTCREI